jgi:hypothetical protein
MKRALNETSGMMTKAARGVGLPLGVAEDLGAAVPFMSMTTLNALADMLADGQCHAGLTALVSTLDSVQCGSYEVIADAVALDLARALAAARGFAVIVDPTGAVNREDKLTVAAVGPVDVPGATWDTLAGLAARTYVPESEASRRAGAGAGLTDND